jgi:hypothetical protein
METFETDPRHADYLLRGPEEGFTSPNPSNFRPIQERE